MDGSKKNWEIEGFVKLLGYQEFFKKMKKYNIKVPLNIKDINKKREPINFVALFWDERKDFWDGQALDLLKQLLKIDKQERLTAKEAMEHPYFETIGATE